MLMYGKSLAVLPQQTQQDPSQLCFPTTLHPTRQHTSKHQQHLEKQHEASALCLSSLSFAGSFVEQC